MDKCVCSGQSYSDPHSARHTTVSRDMLEVTGIQVTGSRLAGEEGWQATSGGQEGREEDDMEEKKIGKAQKGYPNDS